MSKLRVLYICHNHPSLHPGGTEIFAHSLFRTLQDSGEVEALFLACTNRVHRDQKPGTNFQTLGRSADEVILWAGHFERFFLSQVDLQGIVPELSDLLLSFRPDIVHIHHLLLFGAELIFLIKRMLPEARIVFTLHDYFPICANDGQMVKTRDHALCHAASPDACHACFPDITPDRFVLRTMHLRNFLSQVDRFIAPSRFLRQRYIDWGLPADRIALVRNGQPAVRPAPHRSPEPTGRRSVFGYFGNLSPYKGVMVAVEAARLLIEAGETGFTLLVHGGMPFQSPEFQERFTAAVQANPLSISHRGAYDRAELAGLIKAVDWVVVPSIWWENAPLVIQEAFQHRRPVICSDIGGMAEAVRDGVDGLHFKAGDPLSLMGVLRRALDEPSLWDGLVAGIPKVPTIAQCATQHRRLYRNLLQASGHPTAGGMAERDAAIPAAL